MSIKKEEMPISDFLKELPKINPLDETAAKTAKEPEFNREKFWEDSLPNCDEVETKIYIAKLEQQNAQLQAEKEQLILQAQAHAAEAKCQRSTVYEIYQIVTGATGEPGDWNGALPVKEKVKQLQSDLAQRDADCAGYRAALEIYAYTGTADSVANKALASTSSGKDMLELVCAVGELSEHKPGIVCDSVTRIFISKVLTAYLKVKGGA